MAANELVRLRGGSWYIPGWTNVGLVENKGRVCLIDSGNDKEAGRKIHKLLDEKNWTPTLIINTHSNADHIGGNDYLQRLYCCDIAASAGEAPFIEHPHFEPAFLCGGFPFKELRSKFFVAKPSRVTRIIDEASEINEFGLRFIPLKGHFFDMVGVISEDGVLYAGDALFGEHVLQKYKIPFMYDTAEYIRTLQLLASCGADFVVPSHGNPVSDCTALVSANLRIVQSIEDYIRATLTSAHTFEALLASLCGHFGVVLDYAQYALVGSTLRSFLSYLRDSEKIQFYFENNAMYWIAAS